MDTEAIKACHRCSVVAQRLQLNDWSETGIEVLRLEHLQRLPLVVVGEVAKQEP